MTLGSRLRGTSNASETSTDSNGSRLIPANDPDQTAAGGILMNGSYGAKNHTASQNTAASDKDNGGPRRCSFKEPLPVRPDKNDVNRRSSISMGVAARASLLSAQNSAAGGDGYTAPPDGYNPSPDNLYSPADILPGIKRAWKRMSNKNGGSNTAGQMDKQREGQDLAAHQLDATTRASPMYQDVFDDDSSSERSSIASTSDLASTAATSTDLKDTRIAEEEGEDGMATPRGHQSRRASFDQSRHDELKHRLHPSLQVLGFDSNKPPSPAGFFDPEEGGNTPRRSPSASSALSRKASTGAPKTADPDDSAPPLRKRRTQTEDEEDAQNESLHLKASDKEKKSMGRFCV